MPGRTPVEAFDAFVTPFAQALACVATCKLSPSDGGRRVLGVTHQLLGNAGDHIYLEGEYRLRLRLRMKYAIVRADDHGDGQFKISTRAYSYTVQDSSDQHVLSYHWHPDGSSHVDAPHAHLGHTQLKNDAVLTSKNHLPTGGISLEAVIRSLITEHKVAPRVDDWDARLSLTDGLFQLYKSWS